MSATQWPLRSSAFNGQIHRSLAKAYVGAASIGEVLAVAGRIREDDCESWRTAWWEQAERLQREAEASALRGSAVTASAAYLRASEAFRQSSFFHRSDLDDPALQEAWPRARDCFMKAMSTGPIRCEPVAIPFDGGTMYGYYVRPDESRNSRPVVVAPSGYDSTAEETVIGLGFPALARGFAVLAFDGPGQGNTLYDRATRKFMRPDYEAVLSAVVDVAVRQRDADPARLVGLGWSFAGFLMARGACGEDRLAALILDPGQYDIGGAVRQMLPAALADRIDEDSPDAEKAFEALLDTEAGKLLFLPRMAAHGKTSVQAYLRHLQEFTVEGLTDRIACPCLICDNESDDTSTSQGKRLADALTAPTEFVRFTLAEGAGGHCEGMGRERFDQVAFDWIDRVLGSA